MTRPLVLLFRAACRRRLRAKGYSKIQADQAVRKLGDGQILAWLKEYGPRILEVLKIILPLLLLFVDGPPTEQPSPWLEDDDDDLVEAATVVADPPAHVSPEVISSGPGEPPV